MKLQMFAPWPPWMDNHAVVTVLVVDRSEKFVPRVANYLMSVGCEVTVALTMRSGLDIAAQIRPRVILMDVHMPDMDALDAIRRLHMQVDLADIPVIIVADRLNERDRECCLWAGASTVVNKQLETESLAAIVLAYARRSP